MMADGDEKVVAQRIAQLLSRAAGAEDRRARDRRRPRTSPADGRSRSPTARARRRTRSICSSATAGSTGLHQGDFLTRDIAGTINGDAVSLASVVTERHGDALTYRFKGKVAGDTIAGSLDMGEYLGATWTAKRPSGPPLPEPRQDRHRHRAKIPTAQLPCAAQESRRPVLAVAPAPSAAAQSNAGAQPAAKKVYRKLTPTSKTFNGQPLYSPEVSFGNLVFVSGKGAGVNAKGDITAQTKTVLDQIEESLKLAGSSMDQVLKVNVYLTDMKNFEGMNKAYINRFGAEPPVRTTVAVTALPDCSLVEIDCIAHL